MSKSRKYRIILILYFLLIILRIILYKIITKQDQMLRMGTDREADAGGNLLVLLFPILLLTISFMIICYKT